MIPVAFPSTESIPEASVFLAHRAVPRLHGMGGMSRVRPILVVLAVVLAVHVALLLVWRREPEPVRMAVGDMQVAVHIVSPVPVAAAVPPPVSAKPIAKKAPAPVPLAERARTPVVAAPDLPAAAPAPAMVQAAAPVVVTAAPVLPDTEPDFKAAYLNNPPPPYPASARRMGMQGRVVLNVEVLAEGACGQISIHQSSGYAMLDNSALQTVKTWRFVPARHAGQAITQWSKVPIHFTLKDNEA